MISNIYFVLEYDNQLIYLPVYNLKTLDEFTVRYDNPLEYCAIINDIFNLGIPRDSMLDAYLSENITKLNDDTQEYNKRYLAIKYRRDNYDPNDLKIKFANFIRYQPKKIDLFSGLSKVIEHYKAKYRFGRDLLDKDIDKIALAYIKDNYRREKECYYKLKDNGIKTKINNLHIDYSKEGLKKLDEEDKLLLSSFTNMNLEELSQYLHNQLNQGKHYGIH